MSRREQTGGSGTVPARPPSPSSRAGGSATTARSVARLPTGPAGSPSVHERLLRATVDVVSTLGYADTRAAHIVQASGLSRTVFYRHFGGKGPAVLAAAGLILDHLDGEVRTAVSVHARPTGSAGSSRVAGGAERRGMTAPGDATRSLAPPSAFDGDAPDRATAGLTALTVALAADPPAAAVLFLEAPAVGPNAQPLRVDLITLLQQILGDGDPLATTEDRRPLAWQPEMRAGALYEALHCRIARGDTSGLSARVPDLVATLSGWPGGT